MSHEAHESAQAQRRFCILCPWFGALGHLSKDSRRVAWGGVLMVPLFWLLDGMIDVYLFGLGNAFHHGLFEMEPVELYMRLLVSVLFVVFGLYAAFMLDRAERATSALRESNAELERLKSELEYLVVADPLTGTFNRRKFHDALDRAVSNATRHDHRFALLMLDIDHFKYINDSYGHQVGDTVLRGFCGRIKGAVRSADQLFRVGGEEFCLLANVAGDEDIGPLAEKLRKVVADQTFPVVGRITTSIGIANFREGDTQESIYTRADDAMYEAKRKGRNCIVSSKD
ncbi:MAG: GGDEF domain-containing protein [Sideroxydans sp.]|nr:GGDEF domain-containing protein [Sideroxydans sp.]